EKHFTLEKKMYGPDHAGSMTPDELKQLVTFKKNLHTCLYGDESTNESGKYVFSLDD
ncbi:MAG: N-acetylneuraminate synthase, partial [Opitutae bacterium]|nr:N-acetylneuraminate synthase [Opitutae bacterium]